MNLYIHRRRRQPDQQVLFVAICYLELRSHERALLDRYGGPPLTRSPLQPPVPGAPLPDPLISDAELKRLTEPPGMEYSSDDVRQTLAFINALRQACEALPVYWQAAEAFEGSEELPIGATP